MSALFLVVHESVSVTDAGLKAGSRLVLEDGTAPTTNQV